jgi:hypothetical protein
VDKQTISYNLPGLGYVLNGATTIRITVKKSALCTAQTLCRVLQFSIMLSVVKLSVVMLRTVLLNTVVPHCISQSVLKDKLLANLRPGNTN